MIMSKDNEYTFWVFLNILITGLCNSSANFWFIIILFLTPLLANIFAHVTEVLEPEDHF